MEFHPACLLFPALEGDEFRALVEDVRRHGLHEPIWTYRGQILDGRNRYRACLEAGVEPRFREWQGEGSAVLFSVSMNAQRRHLSPGQCAAVALEVEPLLAAEAKERQRRHGGTAPGRPRESLEERFPQVISEEAEPCARSGPGQLAAAAPDLFARQERERITEAGPPASAPGAVPTNGRVPQARDLAAAATGANPHYVQDLKRVQAAAPELLGRVRSGEMTVPQARMEVRRRERREQLRQKAEAAGAAADPGRWRVILGDCVEEVGRLEPASVRLAFADPPYNVGVDYGPGADADRLPDEEYLRWCGAWLRACRRALASDGTLWLLIGDEYAAELALELKAAGFHRRAWVKWHETFGVYNSAASNFGRCSRHLFYCVKDPARFVFNPDAVTRPSDRQAKYNDPRASPGGKVWDDVWQVPRLTGTSAERLPDFPTQLPLALLLPVVGSTSEPGDLVLDPFNGSGTTGVAALRLGRRYVGVERQARFAEAASLRLRAEGNGGTAG